MITIHFTQLGTRFKGSYAIPAAMAEETRLFLTGKGYVVRWTM